MVLQSSFSRSHNSSPHHSPSFNLNVMQLNAWLIPVRPAFPRCLDFHTLTRAKRMAVWLEDQVVNKHLDIAILQEVWTPWRSVVAAAIHSAFCCQLFGRALIEQTLQKVLPYFTKVAGSYPCDCTKRFFDSGLMIASRFPIVAQEFKIYPSGSPHDALSSKGVLVAALRRPDGSVVIAASSHLDAGSDDQVKLAQLRMAVALIRDFSKKTAANHPIAARIFGSDMNIDGVEFWSTSSSYAVARRLLEKEGFEDSWLLTPRDVPHADDLLKRNYGPDTHPQLGITSDQHECVKRLDYLWVDPVGESEPIQEEMTEISIASDGPSKTALRKFGVSAKTELNDGLEWRSSPVMRAEVQAALDKGDEGLARRLAVQIDLHDRQQRLSDHAALFASFHFSQHK